MAILRKLNLYLNKALLYVSCAALFIMLLLGFGNMFFRTVWIPIKGSYELIGFLGALVASLPLGFAQIRKSHIAVDIVTDRYPIRMQHTVEAISYLVCAAFFLITAWKTASWGNIIRHSGEVSETLRIPYYPFVYAVAAGFVILSLALIVDTIVLILGKGE